MAGGRTSVSAPLGIHPKTTARMDPATAPRERGPLCPPAGHPSENPRPNGPRTNLDRPRPAIVIPEEDRPPLLGPALPKRRKKPQGPPKPEAPRAPSIQPPAMMAPAPVATPRPAPTSAQVVESLRARVARGEARLKEFDLQGFRFIKPNVATCQLLLSLEGELGSEAEVLAHFDRGLTEMGRHTPADLQCHLDEVRRLLRIAHQIDAV